VQHRDAALQVGLDAWTARIGEDDLANIAMTFMRVVRESRYRDESKESCAGCEDGAFHGHLGLDGCFDVRLTGGIWRQFRSRTRGTSNGLGYAPLP
jgi:hypothetical protein